MGAASEGGLGPVVLGQDGGEAELIVAPRDHLYGLSRMYQILAERSRPRLQVLRSAAELYEAFGLELRFQAIIES